MISERIAYHIEDQQLFLGQHVLANWVCCGRRYQGQAVIVALAAKQVTVELLQPVGFPSEAYPAGHRLQLPRCADQLRWGADWRVSKISPDHFVHKDFI